MSRPTLRLLTCLAPALALLASDAAAGVGGTSGAALSRFGHLSPAQTVQYSGDCWYDNGWNGPGYYPCGNEWNSGFGGVGPIVVPVIRRRHRHPVVVARPQPPKPIDPGGSSPGLGDGGSGVNPGWRRFGPGGAPPNFHPGAATVTPGLAGGGFRGGLNGGDFHQFHNVGVPHIGAPASPGFTGGDGLHGLGGATGVRIGGPASQGLAGAGTFHAGGGVGTPRLSSGLAGGGFHGAGAPGVFQGGGAAFGQGGIGHR